jgi:hypothetical protein
MKLAVVDANIFIDLIKLQMLALLFQVRLEIHTTQEIIDQLNNVQFLLLNEFIEVGQLKVHLLTETELAEVADLVAPRALELADKTVVWLSLQINAIVISGDGPLRRFCETKKLEVRGILWLFEQFIDKKLLTQNLAAEKMLHLIQFNGRLPREECERRIRAWSTPK